MTREIGPELVARIRHVADSLEAVARGVVDSPQPVAAAYAVYLHGEYDSSYGPDAIDEALEIAAECNGEVVPLYRTPHPHATPGEGSVHGGSSTPKSYEKGDQKRVFCDTNHDPVRAAKAAEPESSVPLGSGAAPANIPDSRTEAQRPVAWLGEWTDYALVWLRKEEADRYAKEYDIRPIPLYRSPTLTEEERDAIARQIYWIERSIAARRETGIDYSCLAADAATLRGLQERMK